MTSHSSGGLKRFLLIHASQTGQAKAIADEIAESAPLHGLKADLRCMSLTDKRFCIENESCVVIVVSTTGDGEHPDAANKFYRRISRNTLKENYLEKLNYSLLALGDSNYIKFCLFGRRLDQRLKDLSAKQFYPTGYGDDAMGIETGVDPWVESLWPALQKQLGVSSPLSSTLMNDKAFLSANNNAEILDSQDIFSKRPIEKPIEISTLKDLPAFLNLNVDKEYKAPRLPSSALEMKYGLLPSPQAQKHEFVPNKNVLHSLGSLLSRVKLIAARQLTCGEDVKNTLELKFTFQDPVIPFLPGDSFGFICSNHPHEVAALLDRLGQQEFANHPVCLYYEKDTRKIPQHIQQGLSLKDLLLHCVEIRSVPKKILLRVLAEYSSNVEEKRALLFLSSQEGSMVYANCIRKPSLSVLDVLMHYPSCTPPIERLFEFLPGLKPRFYSVASSPLEDDTCFKIIFNVLEFTREEGRTSEREGVCTGWLSKQAKASGLDVEKQMLALSIDQEKLDIFVYKRTNHHFLFPDALNCPVIMVGPGTGVAPFVGYLHHREKLLETNKTVPQPRETWLFYGCRYEENDFLYKTELHRLKSAGVLSHLIVSFSRESSPSSSNTAKYVHENIRHHASAITDAISAGGMIFVCGDAKNMAMDVQQAFINAFEIGSGLTPDEAKSFVMNLQKEHRYINDVWA